ncbi:hypothetical protein [Kluyvera georgiana]|uniref:hypothetical protein n=1 Tax=Kluyvera georgiana TaxID=73098 RepID=UPI003AF11FF5
MTATNQQMTCEQLADLSALAAQLQAKAEANDDRDTAVMAYAVQRACSELEEARREFRAADATIQNLELQIADAEARGVDKFANEIGKVHQQLRPGSNHAHALKSVVFRAVEFAAQLRQGAEHEHR